MKTIGLLGGMSWESTVTYYRIINEAVKKELGGLHSAKCVLYSVDFDEIEKCQSSGDWAKSADILSDAAKSLQAAGADFVVICTNTMHKVANDIQKNISIPILNIADVTAEALKERNITTAALLGTNYTMEQEFYKDRLKKNGINVIVPEKEQRMKINSVIFNELCVGVINETSKQLFLKTIGGLAGQGAGGAILGCTEIGMLVKQKDTSVPIFDTTVIHAEAAARMAIGKD